MDGMDDLKAHFERMLAEQEEHAASCTDTPCDRCRRYVCKCGQPTPESGMRCDACMSKRWQADWSRKVLQRIPKGFSEASLEAEWLVKLVGPKVIADARAALAAERVVAVGPPGSGKTSLIAAMAIASPAPSRPGTPFGFDAAARDLLWVSAHQLAKARAFHPLGAGEAPLIEHALDVSVLVVDELGGEDQKYASAVAEVLYERHADMRPTWVTTGVGPEKIAERYGGGIARRVFEDATVFRLGKRT